MVVGVPGALLGAGRAYPDAGSQQVVDGESVALGGSRKEPGCDVAHICAVQAERDAGAHLGDIGLGEIGVYVRNTSLGTVQARVDGGRDLRHTEWDSSR
jgi:hypothetical protein